MNYQMTTHGSEIRKWEPCKAKTLTAAKREATRRYSGGFRDDLIIVAEVFGDGQHVVRATRLNWFGAKWAGIV